jgi:hypothetical protein
VALPDKVNIDCPYQGADVGGLRCTAVHRTAFETDTNLVQPEHCHQCDIGKIYRELGCDKISGNVVVRRTAGGFSLGVLRLWCNLRKRQTTIKECSRCIYLGTEFTAPMVQKAIDLFTKLGFGRARHYELKAQQKLHAGDPEGAITNSITAMESAFKAILDLRAGGAYPPKQDVTSLWKTVRRSLDLGDETLSDHMTQAIGSLTGAVSALGGLRNDLSDAHGKGLVSPELYESCAELTVNVSACICTFAVHRYMELDVAAED